MDSLTFLQGVTKGEPQPVYVLYGPEQFLKRQVLLALRTRILGPEDEAGLSRHDGDKATYAAIHDELQTLPFLSPRRLVVVDRADSFVTRERARLEKYVAAPSAVGVLVLDVQSWAATTRLAKLLADKGAIECKTPSMQQLPKWCLEWCAAQHGKPLTAAAARLLVDLVGPDMGLLDQEMAKLAVYAGTASRIDSPDVDQLVGQNRVEKTWEIFDMIGAGQTGEALTRLNRLLEQGEDPIRLLGAFSMQLRRLAQVARLNGQGVGLEAALEQAGVPVWGRKGMIQQLRHLGHRRLDQVYDWLVETDLAMKTTDHLPPPTLLERLVVQLARGR
jgi:DNA polymerase-3 subunit delta